jgi:tripartite-type tricarboxylate transporter receptor subunit TctC
MALIIPAPPGSRHDTAGRITAQVLAKELGEPVNVVNHAGSSAEAHAAIASAPPDGRTLGLVTVDITTMHWRGLSPLAPTDFTPLALMSEDPAGVHVKSDGRFKDAKQLADQIRANPGKLRASGVAHGGIWHLSTVGWLAAAGLPAEALPWVAAAGPAAALQELAVGGIDVVVCSVPEVRGTPEARTTRSIAVMARQRNPRYPEVPTLQEATRVAHVAGAWRGVAGPKGLSRDAATRLAAALKKTWDSKEFREPMQQKGFALAWADGPRFGEFMEARDKSMAVTVKAAGLAKA